MYSRSHEDKHFLVLKKGEELMASLTRFLQEKNITAGSITGLGAVEKVDLAYYDLPTQTYQRKVFPDIYELVSATGNAAMFDGKHFPHVHVAISDREYRTYGGHLFAATVAATVELSILQMPLAVGRAHDEETGLKLCMP
jgi:predicted DNA-binding protein with PD1-like motif